MREGAAPEEPPRSLTRQEGQDGKEQPSLIQPQLLHQLIEPGVLPESIGRILGERPVHGGPRSRVSIRRRACTHSGLT